MSRWPELTQLPTDNVILPIYICHHACSLSPSTMSTDKELYKLELLSLVSRVAQELFNHTKLQDKNLAEFVIAVSRPLSPLTPVTRAEQIRPHLSIQTRRDRRRLSRMVRQEPRPRDRHDAPQVQAQGGQGESKDGQLNAERLAVAQVPRSLHARLGVEASRVFLGGGVEGDSQSPIRRRLYRRTRPQAASKSLARAQTSRPFPRGAFQIHPETRILGAGRAANTVQDL